MLKINRTNRRKMVEVDLSYIEHSVTPSETKITVVEVSDVLNLKAKGYLPTEVQRSTEGESIITLEYALGLNADEVIEKHLNHMEAVLTSISNKLDATRIVPCL